MLRPMIHRCVSYSSQNVFRHFPVGSTTKLKFTRSCFTFDGLPFTVTHNEAVKIISSNKKILEDTNSQELTMHDSNNNVKECFIPFHSASVFGIKSSYSGNYGIDRT